MSETILALEGVSKSYSGKPAVQNLGFTVERGTITGFLGPNGAGKTTSLRMSLGILAPDAGKVRLFGKNPGAAVMDRVGFLPEERGIYKKMKTEDVIVFYARLKGMHKDKALDRAVGMLKDFDLGHTVGMKVKELSKGMAQKVQIISTLIHEPEFIILDEPFSGLDPVNQKSLEAMVKSQADEGRTVLFSTHVMEHAERLCNKIILVTHGNKIFDGSVAEALGEVPRRVIIEAPADQNVGDMLGALGYVVEDDQAEDGNRCWHVDMKTSVDAQDVLKACVDGGVTLARFEPVKAHLHDAFVHMVEASPHKGQETV
jgi:ABC-2 type transport system ATP-binding protein